VKNAAAARQEVMVTNPEYFRQALESYQHDPCWKKEENIVQNKTGSGRGRNTTNMGLL
jgi:hypothetical protein